MFKVKHKYNKSTERIYDVKEAIRESSNGNWYSKVEFLIYSNDNIRDEFEWVYVDADDYEPI